MAAASGSSSSLGHLPALPSATILASVAGSNAAPGSLLLLPFAAPNASSPLYTLKPYVASARHATCIIAPNIATNTDGLIVSAEEGKNIIYVYNVPCAPGLAGSSSTTASNRLIAPEKITALQLSPDGSLLVIGCGNGHAYLYELASGQLLSSWEPHFRPVTVLRFSPDGACLATGGQDGRVCLWSTVALVSASAPALSSSELLSSSASGPVKAYATFTSHLLAITDLQFTPKAGFAFPHAGHLWSSSEDGTMKTWDIRSRTLLTNFEFKSGPSGAADRMGPVNAILPDPTGRFCFAAVSHLQGRPGGRVLRVDLHRRIGSSSAGSNTYESIGGGGMEDIEQIGGVTAAAAAAAQQADDKKRWIELKTTPISLALTPSSSHLLIGTSAPSPTIHMVDVPSLQIIRSASMDPTGGSHVASMDIFYRANSASASSSSSSAAAAARSQKRIVASQLSRVVRSVDGQNGHGDDDDDDDEDVYWAQIPLRDERDSSGSNLDDAQASMLSSSDYHNTSTTTTTTAPQPPPISNQESGTGHSTPAASSTSYVHDLQLQLSTLRTQLTQANTWNKEMWRLVVQDSTSTAPHGHHNKATRGGGGEAVVASSEQEQESSAVDGVDGDGDDVVEDDGEEQGDALVAAAPPRQTKVRASAEQKKKRKR